jgi:signal transduction histidine kinase
MTGISSEFRRLVGHQLCQFSDCHDLTQLAIYVAVAGEGSRPQLVSVGRWPPSGDLLPPAGQDAALLRPDTRRRWWPLRRNHVLLGALRAEVSDLPWSESLVARLEACSRTLTEALSLELERGRLEADLDRQRERLGLLVHQLRNPLSALRTFAQLLLRRMGPDAAERPLVESLLGEQEQLSRYVAAIDGLADPERLTGQAAPRQDPPLLLSAGDERRRSPLAPALEPLVQRAAARAALAGRAWRGPEAWPDWRGDAGSVAEIVANLLDNAFRYSRDGAAVGLHVIPPRTLCVWDGGLPIPTADRARIFEAGVRGSSSGGTDGTGRGLALARDLAHRLGGDLQLVCPPRRLSEGLPGEGNGFCLVLPADGAEAGAGDGSRNQPSSDPAAISSSPSDSDPSTQAP